MTVAVRPNDNYYVPNNYLIPNDYFAFFQHQLMTILFSSRRASAIPDLKMLCMSALSGEDYQQLISTW